MADILASVQVVHNESGEMSSGKEASQEPGPTFGPHPKTHAADFNFKKEVEHLPFKLTVGDITLEKGHEAKFTDLIYSNKEEFS